MRSRGGETRDRLIESGIRIFGRLGFEAASTRLIAAEAQTNISSILYHFGGKAEFHTACMRWLADDMQQKTAEVREHVRLRLSHAGGLSQAEAEALLMRIVDCLLTLTLMTPNEDRGRFIFRERMDPSADFDILFEIGVRPLLESIRSILSRYLGGGSGDRLCILRSVAFMSCITSFRSDRAFVSRAMGWDGYNEENVAFIRCFLKSQVTALLSAPRSAGTDW